MHRCLCTAQLPVLGRRMWCLCTGWSVHQSTPQDAQGEFLSSMSQATSKLYVPPLSRPHLPTPLLPWQGCPHFGQKLITCFAGLFSNNWTPWSVSLCNCTNVPSKHKEGAEVCSWRGRWRKLGLLQPQFSAAYVIVLLYPFWKSLPLPTLGHCMLCMCEMK